MYTTFAFKTAATAAIVAFHGLTGIALGVATDTAPEGVVQLERVVIVGHHQEIQQLPRVVIEGRRSTSSDEVKLASAAN